MPEISSTSPKLKKKQWVRLSTFIIHLNQNLKFSSHAGTNRLIGMVDRAISFAVSVSYMALENFVRIIPGATQLTRIFSAARSWLNAFVRPSSAVLLTE